MKPSPLKTELFTLKHKLLKPEYIRCYQRLLAQQSSLPDELRALNWRKRQQLVAYACEKVPYYRTRFREAGLDPRDLRRPEDWRHVPLLRRSDIREHFDQLISEDASPDALRVSTTGGSTGEPLKVLFDTRFPAEVLGWRFRSWWEAPQGINEAVIARLPARPRWEDRLNTLMWLPTRRIRLDASAMTPIKVDEFLRRYVRVRPGIVWGYAGAIAHVASVVLERGVRVPKARAIWVTSSPVTSVERRMIEAAFGAPVYDQYGCCEVFSLAAQCREQGGLHITYDSRHIEFLDDVGEPVPDGALGAVAITDLENYYFPIIRYLNGDQSRALPGQCACGITLPLMDAVRGRESDMVCLPDGTCISGDYLTTIFDECPGVALGFQVRQRPDYSIDLIVVPDRSARDGAAALEKVRLGLLDQTRSVVPVRLKIVDSIPHDRGKLRFIISEVGSRGESES